MKISPKNLTFKNIFLNLFKISLGGLAIYLIIQKVDLSKVSFYIQQTNVVFLLFAFLSFFFSKTFAALRINCYYRTIDLNLSEVLNFKLNLLSMFYNLFIPLVGGEGYKVYWIRQHYEASVKKTIWASLLDRISGLCVLLGFAFVTLQFTNIIAPFRSLFLIGFFILFTTYFIIHRSFFKTFHNAWWKVNAYSVLVQFLQITTVLFILMALGVTELIPDYLFIFLISCLAYILPFIAAREMAFVFGATTLGLDAELSLAISLFFYLALALTSLTGMYFVLFPKKMKA